MIRLKGSPLTASRELIAHLKATGRWPEDEPSELRQRDSRNLPSDETQGVEQRGMDRANDKVKPEGH